MSSKRRPTTKITLSIAGPYIEKRSWKTVLSALLDHWPKPIEGTISRFLRIAIDDKDTARAAQISQNQTEMYELHRAAMDEFHRLIDTLRSENPSPPTKIVLSVEGFRPSENCKMEIFWQSRSLVFDIPSPVDLERLMIIRERPSPVITSITDDSPQTVWL